MYPHKSCYNFCRSIYDNLTCSAIHELKEGLNVAEKEKRKLSHGPNSIDVPVKPYHAIFIEEVSCKCICLFYTCICMCTFVFVGSPSILCV